MLDWPLSLGIQPSARPHLRELGDVPGSPWACFPLCHPGVREAGVQMQDSLDFYRSRAPWDLDPFPCLCPFAFCFLLGGLSEEPSLQVNSLNEL